MAHDLLLLAMKYKAPGIRWKTYVNPMRTDGLFVAQDMPISPYSPNVRRFPDGGLLYPAVPSTPNAIPFGLPHDEAETLVQMLNAP